MGLTSGVLASSPSDHFFDERVYVNLESALRAIVLDASSQLQEPRPFGGLAVLIGLG
jgi:hypothetical protein